MINILYIIIFSLIVANCSLKPVVKHHGVPFLEKKQASLILNKSNANDIRKILGNPSTKSKFDNDIWIYIERVLTRGKYHKLGLPILKSNNVAILEFDKYGVLKQAKLYKKEQINKLKFDDKVTENMLTQKSFVEKFLSSIKQKMYGNK